MKRRDVIKGLGAATMAGAMGWTLAGPALAGKGWCRMDPWALIDEGLPTEQIIEFYGSVYTEADFSTIVYGSAEFHIYVPAGHTFELIEPFPLCEVYTHPPAYSTRWKLAFQYMTTNGDHLAELEVIPHGAGQFNARTNQFRGYDGYILEAIQ